MCEQSSIHSYFRRAGEHPKDYFTDSNVSEKLLKATDESQQLS